MPHVARKVVGVKAIQGRREAKEEAKEKEKAQKEAKEKEGKSSK